MRGKYQRRRQARVERENGVYSVKILPDIDMDFPAENAPAYRAEISRIARDPDVASAVAVLKRPVLDGYNVSKLREIATERGVTFTTRTRKAELIDAIVASS